MSHYALLVMADEIPDSLGDYLNKVLEPYQEGDCDRKYLVFDDITEESQKQYETDYAYFTEVRGELIHVTERDGQYLYFDEEKDEVVYVSESKVKKMMLNERYPTFDEFMECYRYEDRDDETGSYGYWYNPNAKWDWWAIGGRWHGLLKASRGATHIVDSYLPEYQDHLEVRDVEGTYDIARLGDCNLSDDFNTYAVLTPDGEWHEIGEMGWFGVTVGKNDESDDWEEKYHERFIDSADPDTLLIVLDLHI